LTTKPKSFFDLLKIFNPMDESKSQIAELELSTNLCSPIQMDINQIPALVIITRLSDGMVLDVNKFFERDSGYSRDLIIGKTVEELSFYENPLDRERLIESVHKFGKEY
jgi:PAS domain-containing protein